VARALAMREVRMVFVDEAARQGDAAAQELLRPKKATPGAAGFDLVAAAPAVLAPGARALVPTGVALALPDGLEGQVRPRSGLALKHGVTCLNSPGTIDSDYRGEVKVILQNHGAEPFFVERGMRIAQLVVAAVAPVHLEVAPTLDDTVRQGGGFGSTGS
jgi:dUTP pyrophosphatase